MPVGDLTTLELVVISLAVIVFSVAATVWAWLEWKRGKTEQKRRIHPLFLFTLVAFLITAAVWLPWVFGAVPEERRTLLAIINIALVAGAAYWIFREYQKGRPEPIGKIENKTIIPYLSAKYHMRPSSGFSTNWPTIWQKRVSEFRNGAESVTDSFFVQLESSNAGIVPFLVQYDAINREIIAEYPRPAEALKSELLSLKPSELNRDRIARALDRFERQSLEAESEVQKSEAV